MAGFPDQWVWRLPRECTGTGGRRRTDGQPDLLLLVGQPVIIVQVEEPLGPPVSQELGLQAEEDAEVALTTHHPDGEPGGLQETADLNEREGGRDADGTCWPRGKGARASSVQPPGWADLRAPVGDHSLCVMLGAPHAAQRQACLPDRPGCLTLLLAGPWPHCQSSYRAIPSPETQTPSPLHLHSRWYAVLLILPPKAPSCPASPSRTMTSLHILPSPHSHGTSHQSSN